MKPVEKRKCTGVLGDMIKKIECEEAYDKMQIASDYEHSKKMKEAGVPVSYSDMHWWYSEEKYYLYAGRGRDENAVPAWSVGAMLNILTQFGNTAEIFQTDGLVNYRVAITINEDDTRKVFISDNSFAEALTEACIWIYTEKKGDICLPDELNY